MNERRGDVGPPVVIADERATLVAFLDYLRESVAAKITGVEDDAARAPMVNSGTSLIGLVKHLVMVELGWFVWSFRGQDLELTPKYQQVVPDDTVEDVVKMYRSACSQANEAVADADLEQSAARTRREMELPTLRWIFVHMIEETARHAGHADILREQIDGSTGR